MLARMVSISWPCDPASLASQSAGITGMNHCTRTPSRCFLNPTEDPQFWWSTESLYSNGNLMWFSLALRIQLSCVKHEVCPSQFAKCSDMLVLLLHLKLQKFVHHKCLVKLYHRYLWSHKKKHSIYRVQFYLQFQASTGGLRMYPQG